MMAEWDAMAEDIRRALQAVEQACKAGEALKSQPSAQSLRQYQKSLQLLQNTLGTLQHLLTHETTVLGDEINDLLAKLLSGEPAPYRPTPRYPGRRILIVEGALENAEGLGELLALQGYHVDKVPQGQAAWDHLRRQRPDALVLNLPLPAALEMLEALEQDPELRSLPVIVLTPQGPTPSPKETAGATRAFLLKPVRFAELIEALERAMEAPQSED